MQSSDQILKNRLCLKTSINTIRFPSLKALLLEVMMKLLNRRTNIIFLRW